MDVQPNLLTEHLYELMQVLSISKEVGTISPESPTVGHWNWNFKTGTHANNLSAVLE